jgi:hypothetical protein
MKRIIETVKNRKANNSLNAAGINTRLAGISSKT